VLLFAASSVGVFFFLQGCAIAAAKSGALLTQRLPERDSQKTPSAK
jgi:hypothetical protein